MKIKDELYGIGTITEQETVITNFRKSDFIITELTQNKIGYQFSIGTESDSAHIYCGDPFEMTYEILSAVPQSASDDFTW